MRIGPSTDYDVVTVLTENQKVEAENGEGIDGWVQVKTDKVTGYVNRSYLSEEPKVAAVVANTAKNEKAESGQGSSKESNQVANVAEQTKQPESESSKPINDAARLSTVDSNNQLILVTADGYNTSRVRVQTFDRNANGQWQRQINTSGFIGKNGFSDNKVEGDGKSPTGKYSIGTAFGRNGNPGTRLPFNNISNDDVWVDDSNSSLYNSWQSKSATQDQWNSAENMDIPLYTYGFVINYNTARTPGKGSAIFFHVANGHTLGCTGVSQSEMVKILKWLDPGKNPIIIQTTQSNLQNY